MNTTAPHALQQQQPSATAEEVQEAIAREQQHQLAFLHNRVMELSIAAGRLETRNAQLEAECQHLRDTVQTLTPQPAAPAAEPVWTDGDPDHEEGDL